MKKVNQESKEHQDLVVFPDQKDLKEVQATLDSRDPTVNLVSKDLKEKTAKMVLMVKREKQDLLVMLVLLVKWEPLGLLANLVPREQRVLKVALDCLVTKVTKVGPAFLVLLELLVTRESPDHKVLQDYEAHLEHRYTHYLLVYSYFWNENEFSFIDWVLFLNFVIFWLKFWLNFGPILVISWSIFGDFVINFWGFFGQLFVEFWSFFG